MNDVASRTRSRLFKKECGICRERVLHSSFISTKGCVHKYCTKCCKRHVEVRMLSGSTHMQCPHENCHQNYDTKQCKSLLSKSNFDILKKKRAEAATPPARRLYCPYRECSAFMKKPELRKKKDLPEQSSSNIDSSTIAETFVMCKSCCRGFCFKCNIPWHADKTCGEVRAETENSKLEGDEKLRNLAKLNKWQICGECKRVVEKTSGCNHMTCVCRNLFCYGCGETLKTDTHCKC